MENQRKILIVYGLIQLYRNRSYNILRCQKTCTVFRGLIFKYFAKFQPFRYLERKNWKNFFNKHLKTCFFFVIESKRPKIKTCWKQDVTMLFGQHCSMLSTILCGIVTPDCGLIQAQQYCLILLPTGNNVAPAILLHPVFNNLLQHVIFVEYIFYSGSLKKAEYVN